MIPLVPTSRFSRMRMLIPSILLVLLSLSLMVFYGANVSQFCSPAKSRFASTKPDSFFLPRGNCNCSVIYVTSEQGEVAAPSLTCQCHEYKGPGSNNTLDCPQSPAPEIQIVEKEVIKEVQKECPTCSTSEGHIVEKEVIKEVEKECPICSVPETQIVKKEIIKEVEKECPRVPWHSEGKQWHYPATFPLCSMDTCFNYSRCDHAEELSIYTYFDPIYPWKYFQRMSETKYHTNNPQKACLFLVPLENSDPWKWQDPTALPYWNGGLNHVLVSFADKYGLKAPKGEKMGNASIVATDIQGTTYRPGFDISIALPAHYHMRQFQSVKAFQRKYLVTFRGLRYMGYTDDGNFRSRKEFRELHNGNDVIVVTSCKQVTNNQRRKEHPELGVHCDEDEVTYAKYDFVDLMNTTFALVPAGRQPASYRFIEVLSAGAIPVLIADNYVKPFDTLIQWHKCLLQFPTSEMHRIIKTLRALDATQVLKRQQNCLQIYEEFLKDDETLLESTVRSLKARFLGAIPSLSEVRRRR